MIKKEYVLIIVLLIIIFSLSFSILNIDDSNISHEVLANNSDEPGTVEVIRNIGNPDGEKIAYVIGVHPLEHLTHETLLKTLPKTDNLNHCYDIYIINVTRDVGSYDENYTSQNNPGRENGQYLAYKYVFPEILNGNYKLAVDVHSNIGAYPYKTFVFSPVKEGLGSEYAHIVSENCENITYYTPSSTTSGPFLTIPLNENGIPSFYFEEYSFANQNVKDIHMIELIRSVDNLNF